MSDQSQPSGEQVPLKAPRDRPLAARSDSSVSPNKTSTGIAVAFHKDLGGAHHGIPSLSRFVQERVTNCQMQIASRVNVSSFRSSSHLIS
jgi:hypothetical protein